MPNCSKRTRRRLIVCLSLIAACAVLLFFYSDLRRRGPFWDKYQQVQPGMTEKEVEEILGPPLGQDDFSFSSHAGWKQGEQSIGVVSVGGKVAWKAFEPQSWGEIVRDGWLRFRGTWPDWLRGLGTQLGL